MNNFDTWKIIIYLEKYQMTNLILKIKMHLSILILYFSELPNLKTVTSVIS